MKNKVAKTSLIAGALIISASTFAQKKNETSAAVEFKTKYQVSMGSGDIDGAKKALIAAKGFIDLAAEHVETKESPKTLYYKGEIYANFLMVGMQTMDTTFMKLGGDDALETAIAAYKKGFDVSDKFDSDIREAVYQKKAMLDPYANMLYKNNMFKEAGELYITQADLSSAVSELDSTSIFNGSLCFEKGSEFIKAAEGYEKLAKVGYKGTTTYVLASSAYRKGGNIEKAKAIVAEGRKKHPSDRDLLLELVNTNIDAGDAAGAEAALNEAITKDPNNKQLHYTIGTIYIDLKENEKAEQALNKSLEIDPNYADALYQLGAHLVTWAGDTKTAANQLKFGDPNYNKMLQQADDTYKRALVPLEKYIGKNPNDKDVLTILFQLNRSLGNTEKALEYKKRADAIK
ncbi:MAG: tetratricopeptide repeat protein [Crocinitomicaceae bacterium]|jgi:tetratricopeptide (TPR) repeat protein|nr:tetratricopeptide repeat protein [Crocinitomicaceae bacterium]MDP4866183.1 tetratricopeptide repeat protein [Crocinitomicaceae bacterium]